MGYSGAKAAGCGSIAESKLKGNFYRSQAHLKAELKSHAQGQLLRFAESQLQNRGTFRELSPRLRKWALQLSQIELLLRKDRVMAYGISLIVRSLEY